MGNFFPLMIEIILDGFQVGNRLIELLLERLHLQLEQCQTIDQLVLHLHQWLDAVGQHVLHGRANVLQVSGGSAIVQLVGNAVQLVGHGCEILTQNWPLNLRIIKQFE